MPEGDTIHRSARRLGQALAGALVTGFETPRLIGPGPAPGTVIDRVEARGKYLLITFGDGTVLETHMKMSGSWHLYRPGERWRRSPATARAVITTPDWVAVCFAAPHVVLHRPRRPSSDPADPGGTGAGRSGAVAGLGPDLCSPRPDADEILLRLDTLIPPDTPMVDVLLDQRLFCGVGNVYKSEVLYAVGVHPATPVGRVERATRTELIDTAHRLLRANLDQVERTTVPGGLAVYGRSGRLCRRCATPVRRAVTGRNHRSTYWCPVCQPVERTDRQPVTGGARPAPAGDGWQSSGQGESEPDVKGAGPSARTI